MFPLESSGGEARRDAVCGVLRLQPRYNNCSRVGGERSDRNASGDESERESESESEGLECPPGTPELCGESCVDTNTNPSHCGGCDAACGAELAWACAQGNCLYLYAWGETELIESDNSGNAYGPQVAIDPSGNAFSVWQQSDGTRYNIWTNVHEYAF